MSAACGGEPSRQRRHLADFGHGCELLVGVNRQFEFVACGLLI